jgi:hypothetical protein
MTHCLYQSLNYFITVQKVYLNKTVKTENTGKPGCWWLTLVILATQETEIRRTAV